MAFKKSIHCPWCGKARAYLFDQPMDEIGMGSHPRYHCDRCKRMISIEKDHEAGL